ncbi:MAG TPA: serine/threonine-protein kinase [Streptosporangiaceae bacterium]|nr:serine/threonine-protein kinase [Streptosporangiaceae bacterium]
MVRIGWSASNIIRGNRGILAPRPSFGSTALPAIKDVHPALVDPLRPWDPERIGGFTLLGRLGAGSMGRVYLGRSAAGRLVAVKTIRVEFAEEADFRTRFAQEVAAARRVSGAFTAPVVAAEPEADVPWLATVYVPAPPLSALVETCGPLPVPAVRWLAAGCAEALESIHSVGLVHRDLKPSNVLVSPDGPRVIDFGVARAAERIQLTLTRGAVGTPVYMAPEQARDTRRATTASDVYSLGATVLFAATGHGPYQGDSVMDVLVLLATDSPDLTGLPADLIDLVIACLERDPRRRPTSGQVLAHLSGGQGTADAAFMGAPLPSAALAMIDAYRHEPRAASQPGRRTDGDFTFDSLPAGSSPRKRLNRQSTKASASGGRAGSGGTAPAGPRRRVLMGIGSAVAAVALLAAGIILGSYLDPARPAQAGQNAEAGTHPPPFTPPPLLTSPLADPGGKPIIGINQKMGDTNTIFLIQGRGWRPGTHVTIRLVIHGMTYKSPIHPIVDLAGSFNYAINQTHEFFAKGLHLGHYRVIVTGPPHGRATAKFMVMMPSPPPFGSPPQSPPPGQ